MKIVVLDGYALNPGDISWEGLKHLGEVTVYDRTPPHLVLERAQGAEILLTNKTLLLADTLEQLPCLKYVGVLATGYNVVDLPKAKELGITVTNVPAYSTESVAEMTFALLLEFCFHPQRHSDAVREGAWTNAKDFCFWNHPLTELHGKALGIVGYGHIGRRVAEIALAFGMKVVAYTRTPKTDFVRDNFSFVSFEALLTTADVISLHCPLTKETEKLISREALSKMKPTAILLNSGRGGLLDEEAVADALNDGRLAGLGADVLSEEPANPKNPLLTAKNCIITPHIAWATKEARGRLMQVATENVKAFLEGRPQNIVCAP